MRITREVGHTPGPWTVEADGNVYETERGRVLAIVASYNMSANSALIAAAPELLQALRDCMSALERTKYVTAEEQWEVMACAENAISKAEGGQS